MRKAGGLSEIVSAIKKLGTKHDQHIAAYGEGNERRLTGLHETASIENFSFGVANRGCSVRIPRATDAEGCGYLEDRRPSSNCDPYVVTSLVFKTSCDPDGEELDIKVIDTGIGLERVAWICNGSATSYQDTFANAYEYLKRLTDLHRVHLFDVVMQYRAIFGDGLEDEDADSSQGADQGADQNDDLNINTDGGLLYGWSAHRVGTYLALVEKTLPRIDEGGALASVMEHCGYCGGSLARVGLDFRPMLPPLFADAANGIFTRVMDVVAGEFERTVETHR